MLVVTHGGALNIALTHVLQLPLGQPRRFSISNASLNEVRCPHPMSSLLLGGCGGGDFLPFLRAY